MTFGQRLKTARENAGYAQWQLAEACQWGEGQQGQSRIANYESGLREPTLKDIELMAGILGVPPEELAFETVGLTPDETKLIQAWRLSNHQGKGAFRALIDAIRQPRRHKRLTHKNNNTNHEPDPNSDAK